MKPSTKSRPAKSPKPKPRKYPGRYGRVWLSAEFVTWAKGEHLKPAALAACVVHTLALENPGRPIVIQSETPDTSHLYDLPGEDT